MASIKTRTGKNGNKTYEVRYTDKSKKSGYSYKNFKKKKEAREFCQNAEKWTQKTNSNIKSVEHAIDLWLDICEKEGTDGREPVTLYTLKCYQYRASVMKSYNWGKSVQELTTPDIIEFRSWLLRNHPIDLSKKILTSFHTVLKEMMLRGIVTGNVVSGVSIKKDSRNEKPVLIPSLQDIKGILDAADRLALSTNKQIAKTWKRYRPILNLAIDSGMRPQEYLALPKSAVTSEGIFVERAIERGGNKLSVTKSKAGRRFIDLSKDTLAMLNEYIKTESIENDYDLIFSTNNGRWIDPDNWRKRGFLAVSIEAGLYEEHKKAGKTIKKPIYTPYCLRHFYASLLLHESVDLKTVQQLMGHANIEITLNTYGHVLDDINRNKRSKINFMSRLEQISCG